MTIDRALAFSMLMSAMVAGSAAPALAQACTRQGIDVSCDDGRRGIFSGQAIIVGQGVFVGQGKGVVPLDNPSAPDKARCPVLDGVAYCY